MRRAAVHVVLPGFIEAEGAVDGQAYIRGIFIFLAIVFPPANRAQSERVRRFQRLVSAARAAEPGLHQCSHTCIDGKKGACVYAKWLARGDSRRWIPFPELSANELHWDCTASRARQLGSSRLARAK